MSKVQRIITSDSADQSALFQEVALSKGLSEMHYGRHAYDDPNWIVPTHNDMIFYASCPSGFVSLVKSGQNRHDWRYLGGRIWRMSDAGFTRCMLVQTAMHDRAMGR